MSTFSCCLASIYESLRLESVVRPDIRRIVQDKVAMWFNYPIDMAVVMTLHTSLATAQCLLVLLDL